MSVLVKAASDTESTANELVRHVQDRVLRGYADILAAARTNSGRRLQLEAVISQILLTDNMILDREVRQSQARMIASELVGFGPIDPPINDPEVTEIMVNGPHQVFVERSGRVELTALRFRDDAHVIDVVRRIVAPVGRRIDQASPMVDARLPDGSRINAIIPPLALNGTVVTIRKFAAAVFNMDDLISRRMLTEEMAAVVRWCVQAGLNIIVSGGTGSGKTTILNVLSEYTDGARVVTIEDAAELSLRNPHVVRLECRPGNIEGRGEVTIRQLVRNALRMRPDRLIVGECRGAEAFDMLQAMNTGHSGSMTTVHANGPVDALYRLESMTLMAEERLPLAAIRNQIISAVDLVVHVERRTDGRRMVQHVCLVDKTTDCQIGDVAAYSIVNMFVSPGDQGVATVSSDPATRLPEWFGRKLSRVGAEARNWIHTATARRSA